MKQMVPVLSITGSDSTGGSGVQADVKTISALGGYALTVITSVTVQSSSEIHEIHDLPTDLVIGQTRAVMEDMHLGAIKIGLVRDPETIVALRKEVVGCSKLVCDPGLVSSRGELLASDAVVRAFAGEIFPITQVLILRSQAAAILLQEEVDTTEQMIEAGRRLLEKGAQSVLIQGAHAAGKQVTDIFLVAGEEKVQFFSLPDTKGWKLHGVGGTLSSAIATYLALGDSLHEAVHKAHQYIQGLLVYSLGSESTMLHHVHPTSITGRNVELYNSFMALIAQNYKEAHDVSFYADKLCVTARYLSQITGTVVGKTPKQLISDYLIRESEILLESPALSIQEIAYRLGFSSQALFSKFFHMQKGCSPKEFRNR